MARLLHEYRLGAAIAIWGAAIYIALRLGEVRSRWSAIFCGPWGCHAPFEAVLAIHLAWLIVLAPLAVVACRRLSPRLVRQIGLTATALGGGATFFLLANGFAQAAAAGEENAYMGQRLAASLWGNAEWPAVELLAVGVAMLAASFRVPGRVMDQRDMAPTPFVATDESK